MWLERPPDLTGPIMPSGSILSRFENRGDAAEPRCMAVVEGTVRRGAYREKGIGVKVEIRDAAGRPVRGFYSNADGRFVCSLKPGDYFIRAGNAVQWSQLKASPIAVNSCVLSAP